ncbi:hypothetical protein [Streptomyces sp. NPDC001292]|uniref:hypothetical protein n=1 Tax=Streptomyces sp. NPDC001292 TaxID=3364558 RepID=UPI0036A1870B
MPGGRDDGRCGRPGDGLDLLVSISQMTDSRMDLTSDADSHQQRLHRLAEHVLDWSGVPVVHARPTVRMENPLFARVAVASILRDGTIRLPFGSARTSPVAAADVAEVIARLLLDPAPPSGRVHEPTGSRSRDVAAIAAEFSTALGRPVTCHRALRALVPPPHHHLKRPLRDQGPSGPAGMAAAPCAQATAVPASRLARNTRTVRHR